MIDYLDAVEKIMTNTPGPHGQEEPCSLACAMGRILSRDVKSDVDMPPFNKSAMDGFAVRAAELCELPATFEVAMDVPAGGQPDGPLVRGKAASVMTGAPVPEGADTVVQVEWTSGFGSSRVTVNQATSSGQNISPKAEILAADNVVFKAGHKIGVEEISLLAAAGADPVQVYKRPTVAVLSTGDEVVAPNQIPGPSQIRDANGPALTGFLSSMGLEAVQLGRVPDDPEAMGEAIKKGLQCDCLFLSGGVSAGEYDYVNKILEELGVQIHTRKVAVKPGKPTVFGTLPAIDNNPSKMIFGLPGNPVSTMVIARIFAQPALKKRMGQTDTGLRTVKARLCGDIRKKPNRLWFIHAKVEFGDQVTVTPLPSRGSADLPTAASGNSLIVGPKGVKEINDGEMVEVVVWDRTL